LISAIYFGHLLCLRQLIAIVAVVLVFVLLEFLGGYQGHVSPIAGHEFLMSSLLGDATMFHDDNLVGMSYSGQPMSNNHRGVSS
jgi:hypothetical protein